MPAEILQHRLQGETLIRLTAAAKLLPTRPAVSTVWRWAHKGARGVILETIAVGGVTLTSVEAVQRFLDARNNPQQNSHGKSRRSEKQCQDSIQRAESILSAAGI